MNWEQIKEIVIAFSTSTVGATFLAVITKFIVDYCKSKVTAKATKLNDADKAEIAEKVISAISGKITIDMEDELNKATRNLIGEMRETLNTTIAQNNEMKKVALAQAKVISQFKTIQGTSALDELHGVMSSVSADYITNLNKAEIAYEVETPTATETKTKGTFSY